MTGAPEKAVVIRLSELGAGSTSALNERLIDYDETPAHRVAILIADGPLPAESLDPRPNAIGGLFTGLGAVYRPDKPVVAAIAGDCFDESLIAVAQAADVRLAASTARFGFPALAERPLAAAARSRLSRQIPHSALSRLLFVPEPIDAAEALRVGLVSRVVDPASLVEAANNFAASVAALSPFAARGEKETLARGELLTFEQAGHYAVTVDMMSHISPDGLEGIASFVEKRPPAFWDFTKD